MQPIGSSVLLCPEPGAGSDLGVRVTAAVVPGQPGQDAARQSRGAAGSAGMETLPGKESASAKIVVPGGQAQIEAFGTRLPADHGPTAIGNLAPGLVADQWGRDPGGQGRGMASTACAPAASEFWFVGGGAIAGRQTRIVLVNPDETAAVADVLIHGPEGLIDAPAGTGLVIKGEDRLVVRLDVLAPGVTATAVQVLVRTGRVGASVADEQQTGLATVGTDWIPQAAAPATKVYVPGIVSGDGARVLSVAAPGEDDAIVSVRVITPDGTFAPAERSQIEVTADCGGHLGHVAGARQAAGDARADVRRPDRRGHAPVLRRQERAGRDLLHGRGAAVRGPGRRQRPARPAGHRRPRVDHRTGHRRRGRHRAAALRRRQGRGHADRRRVASRSSAGKLRYIKLDPPAGVDWYTAVVTPVEGSGPRPRGPPGARAVAATATSSPGYPWSPLRIEVVVPTAEQDLAVASTDSRPAPRLADPPP